MRCSVAWLQRGWSTRGFTLAKKPYSCGANSFQVLRGCSAKSLIFKAAGVRGTGMGCYFDEVLHCALGLVGHDWQSLYHFTIGGPVEDLRLRTVPPYQHLAAGTP